MHRPSVMWEARRDGVSAIVAVGMDLESNRKILDISEENPNFVFPAIGYHPWEIKRAEIEKNLSFVEENIERCIAVTRTKGFFDDHRWGYKKSSFPLVYRIS